MIERSMKILRRPGMPNETDIPAPLEVRRAAVEVIRTGRYNEEELEDALVLIGQYLWETGEPWEGDDEEDWDEETSFPELERRLHTHLNRLRRLGAFIGRQLPAGNAGTLDLIGPRHDGLTIYELKAREIRVGDLAQVENYRLALEDLDLDDLAWLITSRSGEGGIPRDQRPDELREWLNNQDDDVQVNDALREAGDPGYHPDLRLLNCAVIGRGWKAPVARLAKSMSIELIYIPDMMEMALQEISKAEPYVAKTEAIMEALREIVPGYRGPVR